jgi:hypothetical protein
MAEPPEINEVGTEIYDGLDPGWTSLDEDTGWHLLYLCEALGLPLVGMWGLVQSNWELAFDVDNAPPSVLDWLAQFAGVTYPVGSSDSVKREYIKTRPGFARGRLAAIRAAVEEELTGTKTVILREREPDAYNLEIRTLVAETPDPDAVERKLLQYQIPGGIILDYDTLVGRDYADLEGDFITYADLAATGDTYEEVASTPP